MYKFRSMVANAERQKEALAHLNEADGPIFKIKDDPRLTRVGRFLRRSSLDELPQIYNVLVGNMSLVGPRPPLPEEVEKYKPWHQQRMSVIGGITGLWQVSGRSDLTFDELCLLDIYYIENWSLALDVRILLQTIPHSLFGKGAY
jgi:lipopolysaccharide/colanic/teichoic acid biosynthesis glycosyltransferase